MKTLYSSSFLAAALLATEASAQRVSGDGKLRRLRNLNEFVTDGFDSSMSISMIGKGEIEIGDTFLAGSNPDGGGGSGSKSGKATLAPAPTPDPSACSDILDAFNTIFSEEKCGLVRTVGNGEVLLLARESKNAVIQEVCAAEPSCIDELDGLVDEATSVGGCNEPASGQPSGALTQYKQTQPDVLAITNFFCKEPTECNKVVEGLTNRAACWSEEDPLVPVLTDDCIADATCPCLEAYNSAFIDLSEEGRNAFGANFQTLWLVKERHDALNCPPLLIPWGGTQAFVPVRVIFNGKVNIVKINIFEKIGLLKVRVLSQQGILEANYTDWALYFGEIWLEESVSWSKVPQAWYSNELTIYPSPKVS